MKTARLSSMLMSLCSAVLKTETCRLNNSAWGVLAYTRVILRAVPAAHPQFALTMHGSQQIAPRLPAIAHRRI